MRMITTCVVVVLGSLCAACELPNGAFRQRQAHQFAEPDHGLLQDWAYGFQARFPDVFGVNARAQKTFDESKAIPIAHAWAFNAPSPKGHEDRPWQVVTITAVTGTPVDEPAWNKVMTQLAAHARDRYPGGSVIENAMRWKPDTAEFRWGIRDNAKGRFENLRCLGSTIKRSKPIIVCVETLAETPEALASVRESLLLIPQVDQQRTTDQSSPAKP